MNEDRLSASVSRRGFITGATLVGSGIAIARPVRAASPSESTDFDADISFDDDCQRLIVDPSDDDDESYRLEYEVDGDTSYDREVTGRVEVSTDGDAVFSRATVEYDGETVADEECDENDETDEVTADSDEDTGDFDADISFDDDCQEVLVEPTDDDEEYTIEAEIDGRETYSDEFEGTVRLQLDDDQFDRVTVDYDGETVAEETCSSATHD
ncbi:MAG: hypothetical protein ABEI77_02600 [Halorientalis sp.]